MKFLKMFKGLIYRLSIDAAHFYAIKHNIKTWRSWRQRAATDEILCDFMRIGEATIAFSYFSNVLARHLNARIVPFTEKYRGWHLPIWLVFKSFNARGMVFSSHLSKAQKNKRDTIYSSIRKHTHTKRDVLDLKIEGIRIGIDIYESYLRIFYKSTVDLDDPKFWQTFKDGIGTLIYWQDYFSNHKVVSVIVSHDCYISMNIVCKIAYSHQIPVYSPSVRGFYRLDSPFMVHKYFSDYPAIFKTLPLAERLEGIEWAKERLQLKFSGEVGVDMAYSNQTGYLDKTTDKKVLRVSQNLKILIASHCFFDNPHAYDEFMFTDFYEWLHFLGKLSEETSYDWYLKSHPDPLPGTFDALNDILICYPKITLLPYDTSHHQLIDEGINVLLTAHGTIGHEYPYFDIPVINAAYNPHIAYNFNIHAKTVEKYKNVLLNLNNLNCNIVKEEIFEFYFMHYKYKLPDDLMLPSYNKYLNDLSTEERVGFAGTKYFINHLTQRRHEDIILKIENYLDTGKRWYFSCGPV